MKKSHHIYVLCIVLAVLLVGGYLYYRSAPDTGKEAEYFTTFTSPDATFQFMYPNLFQATGDTGELSQDWSSGTRHEGLVLAQVSISDTIQPQTNFRDAQFRVGASSDPEAVVECYTEGNGSVVQSEQMVLNGTSFTKITYGDAGAGNFYDTTSYRTVHADKCYVVEYTIHFTNIGNYSPDQGITEFDEDMVKGMLDAMAQSFIFL